MEKKVVSLFSNIGVGEAYLEEVGFKVVVACDLDRLRSQVYGLIYPGATVVCGDINKDEVAEELVARAKGSFLLIATPPCQGFSTLNPKGSNNLGRVDPRNNLVFRVFQMIEHVRPAYALLENVPQMVKAFENRDMAAAVKQALPGYAFRRAVVDAADFGTPQRRRRAIVLFSRDDLPLWDFPPKSVAGPITLEAAIGSLPPLESGDQSGIHEWHFAHTHSPNHVEWMRYTPTGETAYANESRLGQYYPSILDGNRRRKIKGFSNTYKRMRWDEPAPTLIQGAHMVSSSNTVHPGRPLGGGRWSDARTLSVLEAMIVMGLADYTGGRVYCCWKYFPKPAGCGRLRTGDEIRLSYVQAMRFLGEGLCPRLLKSLVRNIPTTGGDLYARK